MKLASTLLPAAMIAAPTLALAQDSTNAPSTAPSTDCSGSAAAAGPLNNTTPE